MKKITIITDLKTQNKSVEVVFQTSISTGGPCDPKSMAFVHVQWLGLALPQNATEPLTHPLSVSLSLLEGSTRSLAPHMRVPLCVCSDWVAQTPYALLQWTL